MQWIDSNASCCSWKISYDDDLQLVEGIKNLALAIGLGFTASAQVMKIQQQGFDSINSQ